MSITINGSGAISGMAPALIQNAQLGTGVVAQNNLASNVVGNGPAFSAYKSANATLSHNTLTKVTFDSENYDTNNNFASSTFTPTVAGYYQIVPSVDFQLVSTRAYYIDVRLYKNGGIVKYGTLSITSSNGAQSQINPLFPPIYMNGTTDYIELYAYHFDYTAAAAVTINGTAPFTTFGAYLVRAA
jgi:hypothetical protein